MNPELGISLLLLGAAFAITLLVTPVAIWLGRSVGLMDQPGELTIHHTPIPRSGGLAIVLGWLGALGIVGFLGSGLTQPERLLLAGIIVGSGILAMAGLLDDTRRISPLAKLLLEILGVGVAVGFGLQLGLAPAMGVGVALTIFYLLGGSNAVNLLDGMDGLAAGVTALAAISFATMAALESNTLAMALALPLAGAALGFLPFNFPRARVFMGDSGSLFLGFCLASLAVLLANRPWAFNLFAAGIVIIGIPVLDTSLAILRRFAKKADVFSGDRLHVYDVLADSGLGRTRTVLLLWLVTALLGALAMLVRRLSPFLALLLLGLAGAAIVWLGLRQGLAGTPGYPQIRQALSTARRRYLHPLLIDGAFVVVCFYLGLWLRFSGEMPGDYAERVVYAGTLTTQLAFIVFVYLFANLSFGLYDRMWRYASSYEAVRIFGSAVLATGVVLLVDVLWGDERPIPISVVALGGFFSFTAFMAFRYRWRLALAVRQKLNGRWNENQIKVLIVGAGEFGQLSAWQLQHHPEQRFRVIGLIDDDPIKNGMRVHDLKVLGERSAIPRMVSEHGVDVVAIAIRNISNDGMQELLSICEQTPAQTCVVPDLVSWLRELNGLGRSTTPRLISVAENLLE